MTAASMKACRCRASVSQTQIWYTQDTVPSPLVLANFPSHWIDPNTICLLLLVGANKKSQRVLVQQGLA